MSYNNYMEFSTRDTGKKASSMVMVRSILIMAYTLKEGLKMALFNAKMGYLCALMGRSTEVSFI